MELLRAYKLFRVLKSGEITPLFINKIKRLPLNEWMQAENHPTKNEFFIYQIEASSINIYSEETAEVYHDFLFKDILPF